MQEDPAVVSLLADAELSALSRRNFLKLASSTAVAASCGRPVKRVLVFHAGSLALLLGEVSKRFERNHPAIRIDSESSGSLDAIRKVTDLGRSCDILITADHRLLDRSIVPERAPGYFQLVGNEMVLAGSTGNRELPGWREEWHYPLLDRPFGISDPTRDPAGYFAHLVWKLSEIHYNRPGLYRALSRRLDPRWMRPKSAELVSLLQAGVLDFAFLYLSTALQSNLPYLRLPPQISLGDPAYAEAYSRVFIEVPSPEPERRSEVQGAPIRAGVALLAPLGSAASSFLDFLISGEAQQLFPELGYTQIPIRRIIPGNPC